MGTVTTHWLCIVCSDPEKGCGQVEHDSTLDRGAVGPPEGWGVRRIVWQPGGKHQSDPLTAGVCPSCRWLTNEQAYEKAEHKNWKFAEDVT